MRIIIDIRACGIDAERRAFVNACFDASFLWRVYKSMTIRLSGQRHLRETVCISLPALFIVKVSLKLFVRHDMSIWSYLVSFWCHLGHYWDTTFLLRRHWRIWRFNYYVIYLPFFLSNRGIAFDKVIRCMCRHHVNLFQEQYFINPSRKSSIGTYSNYEDIWKHIEGCKHDISL